MFAKRNLYRVDGAHYSECEMEYENLGDEELRTLLLDHQDLRTIPVSVSTRSFLVKKLKERERPQECLQNGREEEQEEAAAQEVVRSPSTEVQPPLDEDSSERYALAVNGSMEKFNSKSDAIKAMKKIPNARCIKLSSTELYLKEEQSYSPQGVVKSVSDDKANDYRVPTTPELNKFRLLVEENDTEAFKKAVLDENPRLLVTSSDAPEILKKGVRYNALHCAVIRGCLEVCKLLFEILKSDLFWNKLYPRDTESIGDRRNHLIDLYLNTCEEGNQETPLHLACKYGHEKILEYLLGFSSMLDIFVKNKYGESPSEVVRSSCKISSEAKKKHICTLLSEPSICYVRVLRAPDNSLCPKLEKPCLYDELRSKGSSDTKHSPYSEAKVLSSFAGPMSPRQAKELYKEWRSSSRATDQHVRRSDPDRGLERVGRKLAHQQGVPWSEFWEFLNCSCDLSKETGRRVLDEYLKGVWSEAGSQSGSDLSSPKLDDVDWSSMDEELSALVESKLSLQESEFSTPQIRRGQPIASCNFLTGSEPTKLDYDVMLALNDSQEAMDSSSYPYISKWLDVVHTYSEKEQKMWHTPIRVESTGGKGHWRSPHRSQGSKHVAMSNLVYSSSPSYSVNKTPRKLFHTQSSFPKMDLEHP